ncbi:MAG TPA: helix-turn-helix domain-containing protein [Solirubrobacteraceae bacterium]|nr:helix-turn-helix domain-containing protein [Solirubrobacteraceae bacterium]
MQVNRRSQADRSATTRAALVRAARVLFAERGFTGVGTEAIVAAAGVTRGALYHQFADKTELFEAVYEAIEEDLAGRLGERVVAAGASDPIELMTLGANAWLDACGEQEVQQIVLLDGPAVLGWQRWREIGMRYGLGLVEGLLAQAIEVGRIAAQPVRALTHVLVGALDEAGLYIARAEDQIVAREQMRAVIAALIAGLARRGS